MTAPDDDDTRTMEGSPIAIICGGGSLPFAVANAASRSGRRVLLLAVEGWAEPRDVRRYPHQWIKVGQFGRLRRLAQEAGCRDMVFIGAVVRPTLSAIRFDLATLRLLPRICRLFRGGDDHLLAGAAKIFEENGFRLLGAHEVAPEILTPAGTLGRIEPPKGVAADIDKGLALLDAIGPFDVGQAVVVAAGRVLAIEGAEGTDGLLARVAEMRTNGRLAKAERGGVLVKAAKPQQDRRFDLPSIGPATVEAAARAGLAGLAVRAGETIMAEPQHVIARADAAGLFVIGATASEPDLR